MGDDWCAFDHVDVHVFGVGHLRCVVDWRVVGGDLLGVWVEVVGCV